MPRLSEGVKEKLEEPITKKVEEAIGAMKVGKAPGPDGLTVQYYRTFLPLLLEHMTKLFNALGSTAELTKETLLAYIALIPKEGKDPALCGSYRPISLLNQDLKLFAKILANRIQGYLPDLIHLDQMGFIPEREARDNTTKVINLLQVVNKAKTQ